MLLGRNTQIWLGAISGTLAFVQVAIVTLVPGVDPVAVATIMGAAGVMLGGWIAVLANTATTPVHDPQLEEGTLVRVTDHEGRMIGHTPVPAPNEMVANDR